MQALQQRTAGIGLQASALRPLAVRPFRSSSIRIYSRRSVPRISCSVAAGSLQLPQQVQEALRQNPAVQLLVSVYSIWQHVKERVRNAVMNLMPKVEDIDAERINQSIRDLSKNMRTMALVVVPLARAATSDNLTAVYARTFEKAAFGFAKMYLFCLFMRVLLSWFSSIDWNAQPWAFLRLITEPYLQIYRGILPPLFGQLDFTPLFGFLILQDVVEVMAPSYTTGLHAADMSTQWTTSDPLCYFDGF